MAKQAARPQPATTPKPQPSALDRVLVEAARGPQETRKMTQAQLNAARRGGIV